MKIFYTLIAFLFISIQVFGQCPPDTELRFNTQAELNAFRTQYPYCTRVRGISIDGLNNTSNSPFDLSKLSHIRYIEHYLNIKNCPKLANLRGLDNIRYAGSRIVIMNNNNMTTTDGMLKINTINKLQIRNNARLRTVGGFENITEMNLLEVIGNPRIFSFSGFKNLKYISSLYIWDSNSLRNLLNFIRLQEISNYLSLNNNPFLSYCHIAPICKFIDNGGQTYIAGNATDCRYRPSIQNKCKNVKFRENSFSDVIELDNVKLSPNPATQKVNIHFGDGTIIDKADITIYDAQGKAVVDQVLQRVFTQTSIDISGIPSGLYILQINTKYRTESRKLIVEN